MIRDRAESAGQRHDPRCAVAAVELTILMPCLDEALTVQACIGKALCYLQQRGIAGEVLVADNGSSDGSQRLARSAGARVVEIRDIGYGAALIGGIKAAQGRFVIMADADDSYDFANLDGFVDRFRGVIEGRDRGHDDRAGIVGAEHVFEMDSIERRFAQAED